MSTWINGQLAETLCLADRGLAYGDGLFESMLVEQGKIALLDLHWQRLQQGCQRLNIPLDFTLLQAELQAFIASQTASFVCKLTITRGAGQRGYAYPNPCLPSRILQATPYTAWPVQHAEQGVSLFACQTRLAQQPLLAGLKHLNRLEQVLARNEWHDPSLPEGLVCDIQGNVIEGVFSNLFCVLDGVLTTPDLSLCGVAGVRRAQILQLADAHFIPVQISNLSLADLAQASEVFLCNSLYGIWPVIKLAETNLSWSAGPFTRKLQRLINS